MPARQFTQRALLTGLAAGAMVVAGLPATANAISAAFASTSSTPAAGAIVKTASTVTVCFNAAVSPVVATDITVTSGATPVAGTNAAATCAAGAGSGVTFTPATPFTAGDYAVSYSANDTTLPINGGPHTASGSFSFRLDTAAPAAPVLSTFTSPVDSNNVTAVSV